MSQKDGFIREGFLVEVGVEECSFIPSRTGESWIGRKGRAILGCVRRSWWPRPGCVKGNCVYGPKKEQQRSSTVEKRAWHENCLSLGSATLHLQMKNMCPWEAFV